MPSHDPLPESRGVHVLVADDNEDIRLDIGQLLQPKRRGALAERALRLFPEEAARLPAGGASAPGFPVPSGDGTRAFRVDGAANGDQALAIARAAREAGWPIAVAFVDVRMPPGIDGARVARLLLEEYRDIEVVLITAYADRTLAELNATAGGPDRLLFLKKPYARDEVYQLAVSLSEKWSQRRALRSARERLELVLASTKDGLLGLDSSHGIVFSNPSARALLGLGEGETGKELWPRLAALSPRALPGRAGLELQVGRRWLEISDVARTRSPGSEVQGVLGIHDVTARKELERLKDEFVQNTSHELR